ncbi:hypothetical protein [Halobacillus hunanensis]|uniref:hypothetical protein n=1 Tax=Halobacillus hunanensis TaxID=578214 RepID=UPI0015909F76|nr:hypothetical protein [Halobacillus hunanensis]
MDDKKREEKEHVTNELANSFRKRSKLKDAFDHKHEEKDIENEQESDAMFEHYSDDDTK